MTSMKDGKKNRLYKPKFVLGPKEKLEAPDTRSVIPCPA